MCATCLSAEVINVARHSHNGCQRAILLRDLHEGFPDDAGKPFAHSPPVEDLPGVDRQRQRELGRGYRHELTRAIVATTVFPDVQRMK